MNLNFEKKDLFDNKILFEQSKVTITVQKRNGKKCITTIIGMAIDLDLPKILSYFKKTYNCSGSIIRDEKYGEVITLTGDQKDNMYNFLINEEINKKEDIIVKGA
jgi:translation initiation factor 1